MVPVAERVVDTLDFTRRAADLEAAWVDGEWLTMRIARRFPSYSSLRIPTSTRRRASPPRASGSARTAQLTFDCSCPIMRSASSLQAAVEFARTMTPSPVSPTIDRLNALARRPHASISGRIAALDTERLLRVGLEEQRH